MSRSKVMFKDPQTSIVLGLVAVVAGSLLLHDGYERRGKSRPWALKLLPSA